MRKFSGKIFLGRSSFTLIVMLFIAVLFGLFLHLINIDNKLKNFNNYQEALQSIGKSNFKMEAIFRQKYRLLKHVEPQHIQKEIEKQLYILRHSSIASTSYGKGVYKQILNLEQMFYQKNDLMQRFQMHNARLANSIHAIGDIGKTIRGTCRDYKECDLVYDILFSVSRLLIGISINKKRLIAMSMQLKQGSKSKSHHSLSTHLQKFLTELYKVESILEKNSKYDMLNQTRLVYGELIDIHNDIRDRQKSIAFVFFSLAFLFLLVLIYRYSIEEKKKKKLLAYRLAVENSSNTIVITDKDRNIEFVNDAFVKNTGYSKEEAYGKNPNILKSGLVDNKVFEEMNRVLDEGKRWDGELINMRKDGALLYEKVSIVPIVVNNKLVQYLAIKQNIGEYIEQQKSLQQASIVYENTTDGIQVTDKDFKVVSSNTALENMLGCPKENCIGDISLGVGVVLNDPILFKKVEYQVSIAGKWSGRVNICNDNYCVPVWLKIVSIKNEDSQVENYIIVYTNLEEIIDMEEKINFFAYYDDLTKLPNRVQFKNRIEDMIELPKKEAGSFAVYFIDLDRFKNINDTLGHHTGDKILICIADRIKKNIVKGEFLARLGGDEFVLISQTIKSNHDVAKRAEKLLSVIRESIIVDNYHLNVSASIGISIYPKDGDDFNELIKNADSAMYFAKANGKNSYVFYTKKHSWDARRRLDIEQGLLSALKNEEMTLCYQPKYSLQTGQVVGVEALIRWTNPLLGSIGPNEFIPIAEETGMIVDIGYFVLEEACRNYMQLRESGIVVDLLSINVSSIQFRANDFVDRFWDITSEMGVSPNKIELEITEHTIVEHTIENLNILNILHDVGFHIAIDDFGTGYSSMSYLKRLPIDSIKIDKSFVSDIESDIHNKEISKAIIALGKSLEYSVIAEGIETKEQEEFLRKQGCDAGQGYYFAKPMTLDKLIEFMKQYQTVYG
ncbi:MAG: EAL domain-containing protein [Sulfurovum sp.]|nr:EAL domain-containing protein [Sulfurovum sp.]